MFAEGPPEKGRNGVADLLVLGAAGASELGTNREGLSRRAFVDRQAAVLLWVDQRRRGVIWHPQDRRGGLIPSQTPPPAALAALRSVRGPHCGALHVVGQFPPVSARRDQRIN